MRTFRDSVLKKNPAYAKFVQMYYSHGTEVINLVDKSAELRKTLPQSFRIIYNVSNRSVDPKYDGVLLNKNEFQILSKSFEILNKLQPSNKLRSDLSLAKAELTTLVDKKKPDLTKDKRINFPKYDRK